MNLINNIANVKSYSISNSELKYNSISEVFNANGSLILKSKSSLQKLTFEKPFYFISDIEGNTYLIKNEFRFLKGIIVKKILDNQNVLVSDDGETKIYNLNNKVFQPLFDFRIFKFFIENEIIIIYRSGIQAFAFPSALPLWQFDISHLGTYLSLNNEEYPYEVKHFIGIHEGQLIVQLNNATFLFLDSESGKQNKIIHLNTEYPLPSPVFYEDASPAHIIGDSLVWLSNQRLITIDLESYAVKIVKDYFNAPREEQFRFMSNSHYKGLLYFVADRGWQYVTPTHLGVMNPETGEVLWHEQLQDTGGLREAPQATDDKLYIRTNKGALHIFEKSI